jgi:PAS domain S-box-containing protein
MRQQEEVSKYNVKPVEGEIAERVRLFDWSKTALGPMDTWPQSLRTILSVVLNSKFPMFLYWGPELNCIYNDAFLPSLGTDGKHPGSLGKPGKEFWPEAWPRIEPFIRQVLAGYGAVMNENHLIPIYRNGSIDNVYWTYGFSPVEDETGAPGGVLVTCIETTQQVMNLSQAEESADELSFAIEATELATWDVNPVTSKLKGNNRLKEWFGLSADDEVDLQRALDVIAEQDRQRVIAAIQHSYEFASGGGYDIEYTIINPLTEQHRNVRAKGRVWFNEQKEAYRFNGTLQDITAKVTSRKQLKESEARFRNLVEQIPMAIGLTRGKSHVFEDINPFMLRLIGREDKQKVIGNDLIEVMPELTGQPVMTVFQHVLETGEPFAGSEVPMHILKNGAKELGYYNLSYTPLLEDGKVTGLIHSAVDVTEQVLSRMKIEESEQQVRDIIESSTLPLAVYTGKEMRVQFANKAMISAYGKGTEVIGKSLVDVMPELNEQGFFEQLQQAFETGKPNQFQSQPFDILINGQQETHYYTYSLTPLFNKAGEVYGIVNSAVDVTDLILVQQKVEQYAKELTEANKRISISRDDLEKTNMHLVRVNADLDNFIYTASHDLKSPINNIEGLINVLTRTLAKQGGHDQAAKEIIEMINISIQRFKRTVTDLADIAKVEKQVDEVKEAVTITDVIADILPDLYMPIKQAEAVVDVQLEGCPQVYFSEKNLKSVFYNLISNSLKYRHPERASHIVISCRQENDFLVVSVRDNGLGLNDKDEQKVFGLFQRQHSHVEGTGIGLYIVKKMLENTGGRITVESTIGEGSVFRVYFKL